MGGAERRADIAQEAGLFGEIAGEGSARARSTMAGRSLTEQLESSRAQRGLAQAADVRQQIAQEIEQEIAGKFPGGVAAGAKMRVKVKAVPRVWHQ